MQEFYENILNNPQLRDLKMQLTTAMITGSLVASPGMAMAADLPQGQVTYTKFMDGITEHAIERVRIAADGRTAEFLNQEGGRGAVNLFNDPSLFKILQDNQVDVSVLPPDQAGAALFGILNALAFPLIFFGGIFLLNRARNGGGGGPGGDAMNPFNMGKSKAKV
jgi:cell division protease FtsH